MIEIAYIKNGFSDKFGIPRQSGKVNSISKIIFNKPFNSADAIRGIEGFSHLWLIFGFTKNEGKYSLTVRPPRLGGNKKVGVFASRSPFRPNGLGLSSVKLERVEDDKNGKVLIVSGADLLDGTPIYDIKPYLSFTDCHVDAVNGYAEEFISYRLKVENQKELDFLGEEQKTFIINCLSEDPRPAYHNNEDRLYGISVSGVEIKFKVKDNVLTILQAFKE